eukprot:CAMPEP_0182810344 /NCGR_PEP_ID=MMETSP0006_2-20121128/7680_1 /TAXON_ID=97485 /ORGANISM="Prymnesium parvum, Strain Texoma1" /LENGTH=156 /DNA_ID=CAMNT_0024936215 /DNA_START=333 /DNA_END=802 /DNA_ORIENTATION=+
MSSAATFAAQVLHAAAEQLHQRHPDVIHLGVRGPIQIVQPQQRELGAALICYQCGRSAAADRVLERKDDPRVCATQLQPRDPQQVEEASLSVCLNRPLRRVSNQPAENNLHEAHDGGLTARMRAHSSCPLEPSGAQPAAPPRSTVRRAHSRARRAR